ncbi:transglutaminase-like domain-containing protein [Methanosarcina sp. Mfa9]|uniref:transglutaminase-like domain-containing protein n=1 Tax=Methanosarcina sp. Mfa9 TaxID=3439063 RepID=UPI003F8493D7
MPRRTSFKLISITLLLLLTAGCIDFPAISTDEAEEAVSEVENIVVGEVERFVAGQTDHVLEDEAGSGETGGSEIEEGTPESEVSPSSSPSAPSSPSSTSVEVPGVPTYTEEISSAVYPKDYRILSLNFKRAVDPEDEEISREIHRITGKDSGYDIKDVCAVFDYVNGKWEYRYDKNSEFFFGAAQTIRDGYEGDCDDYSIVMSTLMENMGFNTRIVTVRTETYGHAYPEIYIGDDQDTAYEILYYVYGRYSYAESIWYSERDLEKGESQYWLNLDWSGSNGYLHPGGMYLEGARVAYYPGGLVEF